MRIGAQVCDSRRAADAMHRPTPSHTPPPTHTHTLSAGTPATTTCGTSGSSYLSSTRSPSLSVSESERSM